MNKRCVIPAVIAAASLFSTAQAEQKPLRFDADKGVRTELVMPNGQTVKYTAYTKLYFATNVEDSTYQYMNLFVPDGATEQSPIFLRTYIGGYMESQAGYPQATDASGRALAEGYVLVIPGSRGRQSTVTRKGKTVYTGRAPKGLLDLKAAIRYLRHFDQQIPGNTERIITDGTSAGGAMSVLRATIHPTILCSAQWAPPGSATMCSPPSAFAPSPIWSMPTWPTNGFTATPLVAKLYPKRSANSRLN